MCVCVCVCPGHCFAKEEDPGINTTRLCCSGPSLRGGRGRNKKPARHLFGSLLPLGLRRGEDINNKHPQNLSGPLLRGGGVAKTANRAAFVRASVAQEREALSTCINTRNKRFLYCRARLFWRVYSMQYACTSNHNGIHQKAHGVVVSHPLRMRKALGSNPSVSILPTPARIPPHFRRPGNHVAVD